MSGFGQFAVKRHVYFVARVEMQDAKGWRPIYALHPGTGTLNFPVPEDGASLRVRYEPVSQPADALHDFPIAEAPSA